MNAIDDAGASRPNPSDPSSDRLRVVLITGLSGSGKSTAANALEDLGYYCVDNLPVPLLRQLLEDPEGQVGEEQRRLAIVTDVRAAGFAEQAPRLLANLDSDRMALTILFLEASEDSLQRRFSATRRVHPLGQGQRPVVDGIRREIEMLTELRGMADRILDTSDWTVHDVRGEIYREFSDQVGEHTRLVVSLSSFGFKYGVPAGSDLLFDVRFLPNPYFIPSLRELSGKDAAIQEFLGEQPDFTELLDRLEDLLTYLLAKYREEYRRYVTVSIGCTGGRHRSVAICERLDGALRNKGWKVRLNHRDIDR